MKIYNYLASSRAAKKAAILFAVALELELITPIPVHEMTVGNNFGSSSVSTN
jgi:hypothetical protein